MECPNCKTDDDAVIATRKYPNVVVRVRQCNKCKTCYPTYEQKGVVIQKTEIITSNFVK